MAHFAEVDNGGTVLRVLAIPDAEEARGEEFLSVDLELGGTWVQTSYNSSGGKRIDPVTFQESDNHFRYNYAGIGYTYNPNHGDDGAFIPPQPYPSWIVNLDTALWVPPVSPPDDDGLWDWDEETQDWIDATPTPE